MGVQLVLAVLLVCLCAYCAYAQPETLGTCEADLAQTLERSFTQQELAIRERETLARVLHRELTKLRHERDMLREQLSQTQKEGKKPQEPQ